MKTAADAPSHITDSQASTKRVSNNVLKILKADLENDSALKEHIALKEYIFSVFERAGLFDD